MDSLRNIDRSSSSEVNLGDFFKRVFNHKLLFAFSIATCLALAYLYAKIATPIYEVSTTLLIDAFGANRSLGESSKYLDGSVSLIEMEKNIFNEIGIIRSYELVQKTLEQLDYGVTYSSGHWYKMSENFGYFPVEVTTIDSSAQLYGAPFKIELLSDDKYQLTLEADKYYVSNPFTNTKRKIENEIVFSKVYSFGEEVVHDYFSFVVNKPIYNVVMADFEGLDLTFELNDLDDLTSSYLNKLQVNQIDIQASILQLNSSGPVLEKEINFLGKLTYNYMSMKLEKRDEIASNKEAFIRNQLGSISDSLLRAEQKIERFKRGSNAINLERSVANSMDKFQNLETEVGQLELNLKYYKSLLTYIRDSKGINKIIAPSVVGIEDPLLNENLLELKRLYSERTRKKFYKGEKSYDLEILDQEIKNTTKSLDENIRNLISSSEMTFKDKQGRMGKIQSTIRTLPKSEQRLVSFQRKNNLYENLYNYLSQELAKTGIARAENITDSRVIDAPRMVGNKPISPQKTLIYALGFLIGLILPFGYIVMTTSMDDTIQHAQHLERISPFPVAASIAHFSPKSKLGFGKNNNWQVEESFRDLSANLQFLINDSDKNVFGVTSTVSNEGKTFCATNLAINLSTSGKKVLLIDTDFRNPSIMQDTADNKEGLTDYLTGKVDFVENIIYQYDKSPNMSFIPTRRTERNPHELLSNPRLDVLIKELKYHFDYIVIDTPAVGLVSDYLLITENIDAHLFVVRRKISEISYINDIEKLVRKGEMDNVYLILNDVETSVFKHGFTNYQKKQANKTSLVTRLLSLLHL